MEEADAVATAGRARSDVQAPEPDEDQLETLAGVVRALVAHATRSR